MDIFLAEVIGTGILIVIGCGVNANVSLARTNGASSGWIVITTGWGLGVAMGAYAVGPTERCSPQPGRHTRPGLDWGGGAVGHSELPGR